MTSLETVRHYQIEAEKIAEEISNHLDAAEPAILYGSVNRGFGPFNDVDVITLGEARQLPGVLSNGTPVQEHVFTQVDIEDYLVNSPRGEHVLIESTLLHPDAERRTQAMTLYHAQRQKFVHEGRADFLALMLAEQNGDTWRPDIKNNHSFYAMKREPGSKRTITRAYAMAQVLMNPPQIDGNPLERAEGLIDQGFMTAANLVAIQRVNALLFKAKVSLPSEAEWSEATRETITWNDTIAQLAIDALSVMGDRKFLEVVAAASSSSINDQLLSIEYAEDVHNKIRSRTLLWRLMSNPDVAPDVLHRAWTLAGEQPRQLRELGCCAVQLPQFQELDLDPASPLLREPDVQFSLKWFKQAKAL